MKQTALRSGIVFVAAFLAVTLWDVTVNGYFEKPSLNADHFIAGAGKLSLLFRAGLTILTALCLLYYGLTSTSLLRMSTCCLVTSLVLIVFLYSATGMEFFAEGFSEERFRKILNIERSKR